MMDSDIKSCLESVDWCRADYEYFRGGGFSSHFKPPSKRSYPLNCVKSPS